uniref:Uncharacterized protein n=1 Tax=Cannabis sativa TaxID=3483 RepID=A0A803QU85_CANSA
MFSHFSLHLLGLRLYPSFFIAEDISSQSGPLGPFSWYFESRFVRNWIRAKTSVFGHRDELIPPPEPSAATTIELLLVMMTLFSFVDFLTFSLTANGCGGRGCCCSGGCCCGCGCGRGGVDCTAVCITLLFKIGAATVAVVAVVAAGLSLLLFCCCCSETF